MYDVHRSLFWIECYADEIRKKLHNHEYFIDNRDYYRNLLFALEDAIQALRQVDDNST